MITNIRVPVALDTGRSLGSALQVLRRSGYIRHLRLGLSFDFGDTEFHLLGASLTSSTFRLVELHEHPYERACSPVTSTEVSLLVME